MGFAFPLRSLWWWQTAAADGALKHAAHEQNAHDQNQPVGYPNLLQTLTAQWADVTFLHPCFIACK